MRAAVLYTIYLFALVGFWIAHYIHLVMWSVPLSLLATVVIPLVGAIIAWRIGAHPTPTGYQAKRLKVFRRLDRIAARRDSAMPRYAAQRPRNQRATKPEDR